MSPETILQSDALDILFENRNKSYGAYTLRKEYNKRLAKSIMSVVLLTLLLILLQYFYRGGEKKNFTAIEPGLSLKLVDVQLLKDIPKPQFEKAVPKLKAAAQVKVTGNIQIVTTPVTDSIPTAKDLESKNAGPENIKGDENAGESGPASAGNGNDKKAEMVQPAPVEEKGPAEFAEKMPQYPGGMQAFQKFMQRNLKQPDDLEAGEKIVILVRFIVEKDGSIAGAMILNSGRSDLDEDVLKVVYKMPKWIPGVQNGRNVAVYFKLPVTFEPAEQ